MLLISRVWHVERIVGRFTDVICWRHLRRELGSAFAILVGISAQVDANRGRHDNLRSFHQCSSYGLFVAHSQIPLFVLCSEYALASKLPVAVRAAAAAVGLCPFLQWVCLHANCSACSGFRLVLLLPLRQVRLPSSEQ